MSKLTIVKKICLLGDAAVGKTSLIKKYVHDMFDDAYIATIGTKVTRKELIVRKPKENMDYHLRFTIWDILGQHTFTSVKATAYRGTAGALLVCDITRPETLLHTKNWAKTLAREQGKVPMILLANKSDLEKQKAVSEKDINSVAEELDVIYSYTSAKTGQNVALAFRNMGEMIIETRGIKPPYKPKKSARERKMKPTILTVLDQFMDDFCQIQGGQEKGMPILERKISDIGMDFLKPTVYDLKNLVYNLTETEEWSNKPEEAVRVRKRYLDMIDLI
ncbi:MAG: GTP-binding protein [Thermoplasmata archaeon]|nr:MAG: GTP-binding protein [Thermoplasmata archaeon]